MMTAYTPTMAGHPDFHGLLEKLAHFFNTLFQTRNENPHGLNDAMSARLYL